MQKLWAEAWPCPSWATGFPWRDGAPPWRGPSATLDSWQVTETSGQCQPQPGSHLVRRHLGGVGPWGQRSWRGGQVSAAGTMLRGVTSRRPGPPSQAPPLPPDPPAPLAQHRQRPPGHPSPAPVPGTRMSPKPRREKGRSHRASGEAFSLGTFSTMGSCREGQCLQYPPALLPAHSALRRRIPLPSHGWLSPKARSPPPP